MWGKLAYRFEGMTDMINGHFMDDLAELLNSATGHRRKTFYEIDAEFEKMCKTLTDNFVSLKSLMAFLRASLRQTMIRKLSKVGKDKEAWKKAENFLTTLGQSTEVGEHLGQGSDARQTTRRGRMRVDGVRREAAPPVLYKTKQFKRHFHREFKVLR